MAYPVIFDVETQKLFQEVGGRTDKLKVSVVGVYNYADNSYKSYFEKDLPRLFKIFENSSLLIGFNSNKFDVEVLQPYYIGDLMKFPRLDLLEQVQEYLGRRIALDDLVKGTLNIRKQGHGLLAVNYFREGKFSELSNYCLSDVRLTKELYEYGKKNNIVYYLGPSGKMPIKVNWNQVKGTKVSLNLSLGI